MKTLKTKIAELLTQDKFSFSDIHIEEGLPARVRIPRGLVPMDDEPVTRQNVIDFLSDHGPKTAEEWQKRIDEHDGQFNTRLRVESINLRLALFNVGGKSNVAQHRWSLVMRVLPSTIPAIDTIGMPAGFRDMYRREGGIILITGVTGSGKSTTMAAAIEDLNQTTHQRIVTLEDPMEYMFESKRAMISQRQLGDDFPNFATGVKQAMRQDPNIIVIGEVNDLPSLRGAMSAALSGHLVITTMHTIDASQTVSRVIDLYPTEEKEVMRSMFAQLLIGVVSQKLVPSIDGKRNYLAHEIMTNNSQIANIIKEDKLHQLPNEINKQLSCQHLMNSSLADLVDKEKIKLEDAELASPDPVNLDKFFGHSLRDE